ncbi:13548_t:CDS:2, partial [Racocetra fulgida]
DVNKKIYNGYTDNIPVEYDIKKVNKSIGIIRLYNNYIFIQKIA